MYCINIGIVYKSHQIRIEISIKGVKLLRAHGGCLGTRS